MSSRRPGRVSSAALAVRLVTVTERLPPPPPPAHLTDDQAKIWCETLAQLPSGRIPPESLPLLEQLCRHVDAARQIAQVRTLVDQRIDEKATDDEDWAKRQLDCAELLDRLERRASRQSSIINSIAMKLRLAPAALKRSEQVEAGQADQDKPWEEVDDDQQD